MPSVPRPLAAPQAARAILAAALLAAAACGGQESRSTAARPNVVVIVVDDARWDDFGFAGHPFVQTPAVDRLAREGTRFLNAFATTPLCSPSRAAILTGQYAHTNGIIDNTARDAASHRLATFASPLAAAGYRTGFFGKWHMGNDDTRRPGWTTWVAMKGQGEAIDPQLNVDGQRVAVRGYVTDVLTDHVVNFMRREPGTPFMAFVAHKALHPNVAQRDDGSVATLEGQRAGFIPADRHRGRYAQAKVPRRPNALEAPRGVPALLRAIPGLPPLGPGTGTPDADVRDRLEMLLAVDESLGRIVDALREAGALDETAIIFTSDHGYFYGEHGLNEERRLAYEETARVPLVVRYPRAAKADATRTELVQLIDLAPTIVALTGVVDPTPRQGRSLVPLLDGATVPWRSSILLEYYTDTVFPRMLTMEYQAVRNERYKYIQYLELPGMDELYDLETDPYELTNLMGSEAGRRLLPDLQAELARLQRESGYRREFRGSR
jgi:N-acetylglucosamine-6-sulfatase